MRWEMCIVQIKFRSDNDGLALELTRQEITGSEANTRNQERCWMKSAAGYAVMVHPLRLLFWSLPGSPCQWNTYDAHSFAGF